MNKVKINSGLASIIILASFFSGWQTLLIVSALMLLFCEIDEKVKATMVRVIGFYAALTLVEYGWRIIYNGIDLGLDAVDDLIGIINSWLGYAHEIDMTKFNLYVLSPAGKLLSLANRAFNLIVTISEVGFVVSVLTRLPAKSNPITNKINGYVSKVVTYINTFEMPMGQAPQAPMPPQSPVGQNPTPPVNPNPGM